jgi:hypothetical protein
MRIAMVMCAAVLATTGCSKDDPLSPKSLAGTYPLALVNGEAPGKYFQVAAVSCQGMFSQGSLVLNKDESFRLELSYYYFCSTENPDAGPGTLIVVGSDARVIGDVLYLDGCGAPTQASSCPVYALQVKRSQDNLQLEFLSSAAVFWNDPVFTMGPRQ